MPKEYKVEKILDKKYGAGNHLYYLIKWAGWPTQQSTWQPIGHLINCFNMVIDFEKNLVKKEEIQIIQSISSESDKEPANKQQMFIQSMKKIAVNKIPHEISENPGSNHGRAEKIIKKQDKPEDQIVIALQVLEARKDQQKSLIFKIRKDGEESWLSRQTMLLDYPRQLCLFYQKNFKTSSIL